LPQTLGTPPPPQMSGAAHVPQFRAPPQPSPMGPQFAPRSAHVRGLHVMLPSATPPSGEMYVTPQTLAVPPPPHVCPAAQPPQFRMPPQPSPIGPQFAPAVAHVSGVQPPTELPQTLGVPAPPQMSGFAHVPQSSSPPHPSATGPQFAPTLSHVRGAHAPPSVPVSSSAHETSPTLVSTTFAPVSPLSSGAVAFCDPPRAHAVTSGGTTRAIHRSAACRGAPFVNGEMLEPIDRCRVCAMASS
jgi:hypothetical protein